MRAGFRLKVASVIALISGVVTIFVFVTGISSLREFGWMQSAAEEITPVDEEYIVVVPLASVFAEPTVHSKVLLSRVRGQSVNAIGEVKGSQWLRVGGYGIPLGYIHLSSLQKRPPANKDNWVEEGIKHGEFLADIETYRGEKLNGQLNGRGIYAKKSGAAPCATRLDLRVYCKDVVYVGDFREGLYHGRGVLQVGSVVYMGDFFRGKRSGRGVQRRWGIIERLYEGEFEDGVYEGEGFLFDGTLINTFYRGEFEGGEKSGEGIEVDYLCLYRGNFRHDRFDGQGEMICNDGARYKGTFVGGMFKKGIKRQGGWFSRGSARAEIQRAINELEEVLRGIPRFGPHEG